MRAFMDKCIICSICSNGIYIHILDDCVLGGKYIEQLDSGTESGDSHSRRYVRVS